MSSYSISPVKVAIGRGKSAASATVTPSADDLLAAGRALAAKGQTVNAGICNDMAAKLARFGSYASDKQQAFAASLVARSTSTPTPSAIASPSTSTRAPKTLLVPDLFAVMQKHATFHVNGLKLQRKNQDSLVWIIDEGEELCIGMIDGGVAGLFARRCRDAGIEPSKVIGLLEELEANPLAAAKKYGKLAGRCCSCNRDLTDPESIAAGIGPICAGKFE